MKTAALYLSLISLASTAFAAASSSCVVSDANWNLIALNAGGKDYNAGTKDSWGSGTATDITTTGRPPFTGSSITCMLSQNGNAIYVMGADTANPNNIYIYDPSAKTWSTQATTPVSGFDATTAVSILDHDTGVIYSYSGGNLFLLRMQDIKAAQSSAIAWELAGTPDFTTTNYNPTMGEANNHIHFLDVPGEQQGVARIYFIHFGSFQDQPQKVGDFPSTHGQTASVFLQNNQVQVEFIFVPDDGSQTYVINGVSNTTQTLAGPPAKDASASYFAMQDSFVQFSPQQGFSFLSYDSTNPSANSAATWGPIAKLASISSSSPSGSAPATGASQTGASQTGASQTTGSPATSTKGSAVTPTTSSNGNNTNKGNGAGSIIATAQGGQRQAIVLGLAFALGLFAVML